MKDKDKTRVLPEDPAAPEENKDDKKTRSAAEDFAEWFNQIAARDSFNNY